MDGCPYEYFEPNVNFVCKKFHTCKNGQSSHAVHGYHVYKDIWEVAVGETVVCVLETGNFHDRNAVTVEKDRRIFGHLPRKVSRVCAVFLKIGGTIRCTVTGSR